jgi:hypothetical protein
MLAGCVLPDRATSRMVWREHNLGEKGGCYYSECNKRLKGCGLARDSSLRVQEQLAKFLYRLVPCGFIPPCPGATQFVRQD